MPVLGAGEKSALGSLLGISLIQGSCRCQIPAVKRVGVLVVVVMIWGWFPPPHNK